MILLMKKGIPNILYAFSLLFFLFGIVLLVIGIWEWNFINNFTYFMLVSYNLLFSGISLALGRIIEKMDDGAK